MFRVPLFWICLTTLSTLGAGASAAPYVIDKAHAYVGFSVSHLGYSDTQGHFDSYDAEIDFDPNAPDRSNVTFTINTNSVDTNWPVRDSQLRGPGFFNPSRHPTMTFRSRRVRMSSASQAIITGELTLLGRTFTETFTATLKNMGRSPVNGLMTAGFEVTGRIDRTKYGMTTYAPAIGADITVKMDFEMSERR